jgi:mannose-6-phosphate isomerase-like protein (cupin superfamily)
MTKSTLAIVLATGLAVGLAAGQSNEPTGFHFWTHSELDHIESALSPQMDSHKFKSSTLAPAGNHRFLAVHREATGQVEYHAKEADIVFVQSGSATLVYGGSIVKGVSTAPDEMRGESITGGMELKVEPGDVITIPAKLPHQMKLDPGKQLNYFVVKITE